jgi:transposase-like protein
MIFIWGSRGMSSTVESGKFYCPRCDEDGSEYDLKSEKRWFTFFFIPIFPISGSTRYVECLHCRGTFHEEVLDEEPPKRVSDDDIDDCLDELDKGKSIEWVEQELEDLGLKRKEVDRLIDRHTKGKYWKCPGCKKHYIDEIEPCPKCG